MVSEYRTFEAEPEGCNVCVSSMVSNDSREIVLYCDECECRHSFIEKDD